MTRIELNGEGLPIPTEALPDGLVEGGLTPLTFTFDEDGSFDKTEWVALGFTIFEVMCVGGAGGRGGNSKWSHGNSAVVALYSLGGAGGGGGMHIVSGLLSELADISPIVVGQAGADGANGVTTYSQFPIDPGDAGEDGSFSTFADDICQASGGKGGDPTPSVITVIEGVHHLPKRPGGDGGEGGAGGQTAAGGGAAGGSSEIIDDVWTPKNGLQGFWDGIVGKGGGGGVGGSINTFDTVPGFFDPGIHDSILIAPWGYRTEGTDGGHGSFSYADSSKHGQRGSKELSEFVPFTGELPKRKPGVGGGARPTALAKYGSYVEGYSPNGVVIVRIS